MKGAGDDFEDSFVDKSEIVYSPALISAKTLFASSEFLYANLSKVSPLYFAK